MKKRKIRQMAAGRLVPLILTVSILSACGAQPVQEEETDIPQQSTETSAVSVESQKAGKTEADGKSEPPTEITYARIFDSERPLLLDGTADAETESVTPCVQPYSVAPDLGNVENIERFYFPDEMKAKLAANGFVVSGDAGSEFFGVYENNRYSQIPNFVTVDSLMHTYHLYFQHLLKNIERGYLSDALAQLSRRMLEKSCAQYEQLKGTEWESAAKRNVAFFGVGTKLLDDSVEIIDDVSETVRKELDCIEQAKGISKSEITGDEEDYSQYIPRGYYEGDSQLEKYFKVMMWYGRIHFSQDIEDMEKSALLMTLLLASDEQSYELWESIYAVTSFFAGASDDLGVSEYAPAAYEAYGDTITLDNLVDDKAAFDKFRELTAVMPAPQINSIPINAGEDNVIRGFRFMGQRFSIDASIMQKLIYSCVNENSAGDWRMLPDVLDVPAALGSDTALRILEEKGATEYAGYMENMTDLREKLAEDDGPLWSASLYAGWLYTLRPLLWEKGEGYPFFMQNEEWLKKDLECFAGSFTELKHDTVLYSKQVMAEMGGGDEIIDDRGYVEPEPLVYTRFIRLADKTAEGLKKYGMLSGEDAENLARLSEVAQRLLTISNKELQNEELTEDEYEFIRTYGGNIEHFWYEAYKDESTPDSVVTAQAFPAALVVDIATDPNGTVLEAATGDPSNVYVIVNVAGKTKVARGSVYAFYQFPWPMDDRMTDAKWREMMGISLNEEGYYNEKALAQPDWTSSYRYEWK